MSYQHFQQTEFWADFKGAHNWKPLYFSASENGLSLLNETNSSDSLKKKFYSENADTGNTLTVLVRNFSFLKKKFSLAYIPMAPEKDFCFANSLSKDVSVTEQTDRYVEMYDRIVHEIKKCLPKDTLCVRFDSPETFLSLDEKTAFEKAITESCKKQNINIIVKETAVQPADSVILDLSKSEETLLSEMKSKWRYNIKLAEKKGVVVKSYHADDEGFEKAFDSFYELFETTGKRDGISPHAKSYYKDLLSRGIPSENNDIDVRLYMAEHEGDMLAGIITLFCRREAVYLFGASGNYKRNLMPAYLLQWTAIKDAKNLLCPSYDFYGIPPTNDENHPMHGLYLFKTSFGGNIIHRTGSFDIPLLKDYKLYIAAEKLRAWYHKVFLKKIRGR